MSAGLPAQQGRAVAGGAASTSPASVAARTDLTQRSGTAPCGSPHEATKQSDRKDEVDSRDDCIESWQAGDDAGESVGGAATLTAERNRRRDDGLAMGDFEPRVTATSFRVWGQLPEPATQAIVHWDVRSERPRARRHLFLTLFRPPPRVQC